MRVAVGSDHRGVHVKTKLLELLARLGHEAEDVGTSTCDSCDYPDMAALWPGKSRPVWRIAAS